MEQGKPLSPDSFSMEVSEPPLPMSTGMPLMRLDEMEKFMIKKALHEKKGHKGQVAKLLGIDTSTLWRKMKGWDVS